MRDRACSYVWYRLLEPFHAQRDAINIDGLICWSERIIFTNMRMAFSAAVGGSGPSEFDQLTPDVETQTMVQSVEK